MTRAMIPARPLVATSLIAAFTFGTPLSASALQRIELKKDEPGTVGLETTGEYRLIGNALSDFAVDADGTRMGQPILLEQRLRARLDLQLRFVRLSTEWDILSGVTDGDHWDVPGTEDERGRHYDRAGTPDGIVPRRLALTVDQPAWNLEAGLVTSHWGLGLVANDGNRDMLFGRNEFGDRALRLRFTGKPALSGEGESAKRPLFISGAFDVVVADDTARLARAQLAMQGIASVLYVEPEKRRMGLYAVYRHQREWETGRTTQAFVLDGYGERTLSVGPRGVTVVAAAEGAAIFGQTNRSLSYDSRDGLVLRSGGFAGNLTLRSPAKTLQGHLRVGLASGDPNPDDRFANDFTFDRDFDVGMVMFDEVLGATEAMAFSQLTDPGRSGKAPDGVDAIVTEGAFRRAAFMQMALQWTPLPFLDLKAGVLTANSTVAHQQPFHTYRAGGDPRNHLNRAPIGRSLGVELDWAVRFGGKPPTKGDNAPDLALIVQGGHLFPGGALDGLETVHLLQFGGRVRW